MARTASVVALLGIAAAAAAAVAVAVAGLRPLLLFR
jgi:hypothetical protein